MTATALDGDTVVAQARIIGGYVEGEVVTVRLVLEDACRGVICGEGLTCKAHVCVDARTGEDADAGVRDAGLVDGGLSGTDLGARCTGSCDDFNPCTDDSCNLGTGLCVHTNNTAACDDGNPCTVGNVCSAGACSVGIAKNCSDTNAG